MPPPVSLSDGAIAMLSSGESQPSEIKPVLQVADIRLVNTQNQNNSNERYRILLSDGSHLQQGMLATQRNDLVRSQRLQKGSIVQLTQFVCNLIQNRMIIIIIDLEVIVEQCEPIGEPKQYPLKTDGNSPSVARSSVPVQQAMNQPGNTTGNAQSSIGGSASNSLAAKPNVIGGIRTIPAENKVNAGSQSFGNNFVNNVDPGRHNTTSAAPVYSRTEPVPGLPRTGMNSYLRPPHSSFQQPSPMFANRGPVAKNEAPPRIIPIAALNPYQGRWTIKARVTAKAELKHFSNARGEGKVFSFDLLDSDGGEIRVACFNNLADQYYSQIEPGKVYMISKGNLKPAQKNYNHLRNDHEIMLDHTSVVQPCLDDDRSIPKYQFHFCAISDIEGMENNSVVDLIGLVSSISPSSSIMRKNGTETLKRSLQLKDMSGRSVELTMWGNFCNAEGQTLQNLCDSGAFPVLAVKSGRVSDFNGKQVGTISTSQLLIEPEFAEAVQLRGWYEREGKNTPVVSISRETTGISKTDVQKTISQIKDERLGTSEKPDWITVGATLAFLKVDNFCYTACPIKIGDRQCNKKVTNNGDGRWRCDRCDQTVDECDYRYILQLQIQDHTGLTWATAFQECGEEIMGVSAKDLYYLRYEEQDEDKFAEIVRKVLFAKYTFKLKVKEEMFSDELRVKSTVVKVEKVNFPSETRYLLDAIAKLKGEDSGPPPLNSENAVPSFGQSNAGYGVGGVGRESGVSGNQVSQQSNVYGGARFTTSSSTSTYLNCNNCGAGGHSSANCPNGMYNQGQTYGGNFGSRVPPAATSGGVSGECYKCHQSGHWARDCPGIVNAPPAYGGGNVTPGKFGNVPRQQVGGF